VKSKMVHVYLKAETVKALDAKIATDFQEASKRSTVIGLLVRGYLEGRFELDGGR